MKEPVYEQGARHCPRCGHATTPRGGLSPRYCAVCGQRFVPLHEEVRDALSTRHGRPWPLNVLIFFGFCFVVWMIFTRGC